MFLDKEDEQHWSLIVIDFERREIVYLDSVATNKFTNNNHPCDNILKYMSHLAHLTKYEHFFVKKWNKVIRDSTKFQYPNSIHKCNSGLHVIAFADYVAVKYRSKDPQRRIRKTFNLRTTVNDSVFHSHNTREVIFALILLFDRNRFISLSDNPKRLPTVTLTKPPAIKPPDALVALNLDCNALKKNKKYVIDRDGAWSGHNGVISINTNCAEPSHEMSKESYKKMNVHSKALYLQYTRQSFHSNFVHYYLVDDNNDLVFEKKEAMKHAYRMSSGKVKDQHYKEVAVNKQVDSVFVPCEEHEYSDSDEESYLENTAPTVEQATKPPEQNELESRLNNLKLFVKALPENVIFDIGFCLFSTKFDVTKHSNNCHCPCSKYGAKWRKLFNINPDVKLEM